MRKKEKQKILISVIVGLIFLGVILSNFNLLPFAISTPSDLDQYVGQCSDGWTTLSTSDVNIIPEGDRIRVFGVAKGSECLNIRLTESGLDSVLNSLGYDATRNVIGNIRLLEYTKVFPIDNIGSYKGNLNNLVLSNTQLVSATVQNCVNRGHPNTIYAYKPLGGVTNVRCVIPGQSGLAGDFSSARSYGDFDVLFELDGRSTHLTREQQSINLGNHHIEWVGNLLNLDEVSVPQYDARLIGSKWELVNDGALGLVELEINSFRDCMNSRPTQATPDSYFDSCDGLFDSRTSSLLENKINEYKLRTSSLVFDASTDDNNLFVSLKAPPYPAFIIDLDAESVGIIALEGKPKITNCISNQDLQSGTNKIVSFDILNEGFGAEFSANINCNEGVLAFIPNFNIGANEQKTINAELIPTNPNENTLFTSCNLEVKDITSGNSDRCFFTSEVEFVSGIICEPGTLSCSEDSKSILRCSSSGEGKVVHQECEFGCIQDGEGIRCSGEEPDEQECKSNEAHVFSKIFGNLFSKLKCKSTLTQRVAFIPTLIKLILIPIVFIFTLLFGQQFFSELKGFEGKQGKAKSLVISIIVGILLSVLLFYTFWLGVIAFIIFLLLRVGLRFF